MTISKAKIKIIQCHEEGKTLCIILLIVQFGTELLHFLREYLKEKNNEKNTANH